MSAVTVRLPLGYCPSALPLRVARHDNDNPRINLGSISSSITDIYPHIDPATFHRRGSMRIAQISPLTEAVPPKLYGGTERIVSYIPAELGTMGHDLTLFSSGDSTTKAKLPAAGPAAPRPYAPQRDPPPP